MMELRENAPEPEVIKETQFESREERKAHKRILNFVKNFDYKKSITVEPLMYVYFLGEAFVKPTNSALYYRKSCLSQFEEGICDQLTKPEYKTEENKVQQMASQWEFYDTISYEIIAIIATIIYGSLSDRYSRKLPLILPSLGQFISTALYLINSVYIKAPIGLMLVGPIFSALAGGTTSLLMAAFSYLSEVTDPKMRTVRSAIIYGGDSLARVIGYLCGGVMLDKTGFVPVYSLELSLFFLSLLIAFLWIDDIAGKQTADTSRSTCGRAILKELYALKDSFLCVSKKRTQNRRMHIIQLLSITLMQLWFASMYKYNKNYIIYQGS